MRTYTGQREQGRHKEPTSSGYVPCACRDCFDVAISKDPKLAALCWACDAVGCSDLSDGDCCRDDAYGAEEDSP